MSVSTLSVNMRYVGTSSHASMRRMSSGSASKTTPLTSPPSKGTNVK